MPHLRIRGLSKEKLAPLSETLLEELSKITGTPAGHYTLEYIPSEYFFAGKAAEADPFCEVLWFDRGQAVQDQVAALITNRLKVAAPLKEPVVVFTVLQKNQYYENGQHFGN